MPITTSAKKALRQNSKAKLVNAKQKRELHDLEKEIIDLCSANKDEAKKLFPKYMKLADKMAKRNIIAKNAAARKKARIAKKLK